MRPWSRADTIVALMLVALLLLFTFPLFGIANRVEPIILGMPFGMFWIVAWIALEFIVLLALAAWDRPQGKR